MRVYLLVLLLAFGCDDGGSSDASPDAAGGEGGAAGEGGAGGTGGEAGGGGEGGALPDGISIPGLSAETTVEFDEHGILRAQCATDDDCFAVQGYYHAAHRFSQMDIRRRLTQGKLSEMVGNPTLDTDRYYRRIITTRDGGPLFDQVWAATSPEMKAAVEAYGRGVNAWLADYRAGRNGAVLTDEYNFPLIDKDAITDWEPIDSVGCIMALVDQLTNQADDEIAYGQRYAKLSPEQAFDIFGLTPGSTATVLPTAEKRLSDASWAQLWDTRQRLQPALGAMAKARESIHAWNADVDRGSNNWVVGPDRANGKALLANDPHLGLSNPAVWYLVHLDSKTNGGGTFNAMGVSFAGLPGIIIGHNENIAWGMTTTFFDFADVYVEELSPDGDGVMFNGEVVPFVEREQTFKVSMGEDVVETYRYVPHRGPVLSVDEENGTAITMRWTGQDTDTDLNFIHGLMGAGSLAEGRETIKQITTAGQNIVMIDRQGNFGWFPYNRVPFRPWASKELPNWLPLPGDGTAEWEGSVAYEDLPQSLNDDRGFIATANNDMTGHLADGDPTNDGQAALQHFVAVGYREQRIQQLLAEKPLHDMASMSKLQADTHSLIGAALTPVLLEAAAGADGDVALIADALDGWSYGCPTGLTGTAPESDPSDDAEEAAESIGCAAFHVVLPRLRAMIFGDELAAAETGGRASDDVVVIALTRPESLAGGPYWDDVGTDDEETRDEILRAAMADAARWLKENLGEDPDGWRWGRIHTVSLRADLFSAAGILQFDNGPYANDGGRYTVDVANPGGDSGDNYAHSSGASMRLVCAADADAMDCTIELPGGQRHYRESPRYDDLLQKWLVNEQIPFNLDGAAAIETVTVKPR